MKDKKTIVNSMANITAKVWGIVSTYIFIPLYISYLGEEAYGLVSFFATLYSVMQLLGVGLSSTLRRQFAADGDDKTAKSSKYKLLRSVENIYIFVAIIIIVLCYSGRKFIANEWLSFDQLSPTIVQNTLVLMGISIACQIVSNLWHGCILGSGHQVIANIFNIAWAIVKSFGSVIVSICTHSIVYFYSWHIICDILYLIVIRTYLARYLGKQDEKWKLRDFSNMKTIWKYTLGLFAVSIVAVINKQLDKTVISGFLSLTELGAYNLTTTLGSLAQIIPNAVSIAVFTTFTREYTTNNVTGCTRDYKKYSKVVSIVTLCMGLFIAFFSVDLLTLWTSNKEYINLVTYVAPLVVMSCAMLGLQEVPYALALAHEETIINNIMGIVSLPIICFLTFSTVKNYGLIGAGATYLITMSLQTFVYVFVITRRYTSENPLRLIFMNIILPIIIAGTSAFLSKSLIYSITDNVLIRCIVAIIIGGITLVILLFVLARNEFSIAEIIKRRKE